MESRSRRYFANPAHNTFPGPFRNRESTPQYIRPPMTSAPSTGPRGNFAASYDVGQQPTLLSRLLYIPDDIYMWITQKMVEFSLTNIDWSIITGIGLSFFVLCLLFGLRVSEDFPSQSDKNTLFFVLGFFSLCNCAYFCTNMRSCMQRKIDSSSYDGPTTERFEWWEPTAFSTILMCTYSPVQVLNVYLLDDLTSAATSYFAYFTVAAMVLHLVLARERQTLRLQGPLYQELERRHKPAVSFFCRAFADPSPNSSLLQ